MKSISRSELAELVRLPQDYRVSIFTACHSNDAESQGDWLRLEKLIETADVQLSAQGCNRREASALEKVATAQSSQKRALVLLRY